MEEHSRKYTEEDTDIRLMRQALAEAKKAYSEGEIPIGAVVAVGDRIIARGHNQTERLNDPTAHAEIIALTSAFNFLGSKYLPDATLYVTIEPCLMCAGGLYWGKMGRVVYGAPDEKNGYLRICGSRSPFHPKTVLETGVLAGECADLMKSFFQGKR
jgi:tRNA(adenine34) deaminase